MPDTSYKHYNCILIIPELAQKIHIRYMIDLILLKMGFKSIFLHTESVMASYAMALQTACVVDIGSSKLSVCCIDDGIVQPRSIVSKHYGGDDLNELFFRLLKR